VARRLDKRQAHELVLQMGYLQAKAARLHVTLMSDPKADACAQMWSAHQAYLTISRAAKRADHGNDS
jgi:hypothetical protein